MDPQPPMETRCLRDARSQTSLEESKELTAQRLRNQRPGKSAHTGNPMARLGRSSIGRVRLGPKSSDALLGPWRSALPGRTTLTQQEPVATQSEVRLFPFSCFRMRLAQAHLPRGSGTGTGTSRCCPGPRQSPHSSGDTGACCPTWASHPRCCPPGGLVPGHSPCLVSGTLETQCLSLRWGLKQGAAFLSGVFFFVVI